MYQQEATEKTPAIQFDWSKGLLVMEGNSRPEDVQSFYLPFLNYVEKEIQTSSVSIEKFTASFTFGYFNSASAKFIFDIFALLKRFHDKFEKLTIEWCYEKGDIDMKEAGEDFSEMVDLPFQYVMIDVR